MCVGLGGYSLAMHVGNAGHTRLNVYAPEAMIKTITPSLDEPVSGGVWLARDRGNGPKTRPGAKPSEEGRCSPQTNEPPQGNPTLQDGEEVRNLYGI